MSFFGPSSYWSTHVQVLDAIHNYNYAHNLYKSISQLPPGHSLFSSKLKIYRGANQRSDGKFLGNKKTRKTWKRNLWWIWVNWVNKLIFFSVLNCNCKLKWKKEVERWEQYLVAGGLSISLKIFWSQTLSFVISFFWQSVRSCKWLQWMYPKSVFLCDYWGERVNPSCVCITCNPGACKYNKA